MDFILNEVEIESDSFKLNSSEYETECNSFPSSEDEGFLDDDSCCGEDIKQDPSFYRTFDNRKEFSTFKNQIKNPVEASKRSEGNYYKEDDMPELFAPEQRGDVKFHTFQNDKEKALNFKKSLQCFIIEHENQFFYAVVYGLMYHKMENQTPISKISIEHAEKVLRRDLCFKLKKTEPDVMLDYTIFGFFDWCRILNKLLAEFGFFINFYERRNKFRYQLQQKLKSKNEMKTEFSACMIQIFNGYDLLRNTL